MPTAHEFKGGDVERLAAKLNCDMEMVKADILKQRMYRRYRDILRRILKDGVKYTFRVVDELLMDYLKSKAGLKI